MPTPAFCVYGVFSRRDDSDGGIPILPSSPSPLSPAGQSRQLYMALGVNDSRMGYPNIAVITVTAVTRLPCKGYLSAVFFAAVLVADTILT